MSRDPFEHLEQQLHRAIVRRRRSRRWLRPLALGLAGLVAAGGGVAVAKSVLSSRGPSPALRAINAAQASTLRLPVCAIHRRGRETRVVSGTVDPRVREQFGVFRRAMRREDRAVLQQQQASRDSGVLAIAGRDVLRSSVRVTRAASGSRFALVISYGPGPFGARDPIGCIAEIKRRALDAPQASDPEVRARIEEILDERQRRSQSLLSGRSQYLTVISLLGEGQRTGGGVTTHIRDGHVPAIAGIGHGGVPPRTQIDGLVPDVVHDVQVIDRDGSPRARSVSIPVAGNIYDAVLERRMGPRMTLRWRDRHGRVVRRQRLGF